MSMFRNPKAISAALTVGLAFALLALGCAVGCVQGDDRTAEDLLQQIPVKRGLCVVLGSDAGRLTLDLAKRSELILYMQSADTREVLTARKAAHEAGLLGSRIFIDKGALNHIHLADNLADAVVSSGPIVTEQSELLRILRPGGKALIGTNATAKPTPAGLDDWTHPYHGPDNNPVSNDQVARSPYLTQFLAKPHYCALPQISVSAAGRLFKAYGHVAFRPREWDTLNKLIATNAYNGVTLWEMDLAPGFVIHRNTLIATPDILLLGDDKSCKIIDAATGKIKDEIVITGKTADGPVWKWMALENDVLYAVVGKEQPREKTIRRYLHQHGWNWGSVGKGYNKRREFAWGFSRTIVALDVKTKRILWTYRAEHPVDSRALCMKNGRLYFYCHSKTLGCLDARNGNLLWKTTSPELFEAIGEHNKAQNHRTGWSTSAYMKCSDKAIFFAGPQRNRLVAVSTEDGRLLWQYPKGNFQIIIRDDALYAMGTWQGKIESGKFDILTGKALPHNLPCRSCCARATASIDGIFVRGARYDIAEDKWESGGPMRPGCHDGVVTANGLLYFGPWMCDCNYSLLGIVCLGPAGAFQFNQKAEQSERLEKGSGHAPVGAQLAVTPADWPAYRKDNARSAGTDVQVRVKADRLWLFAPKTAYVPTAAVTCGNLTFFSSQDGVVRAIDAESGKPVWTAYTGGPVMFPPTVWEGRVFVGSGDGWVYCFRARDGSLLWRFRCAPVERMIPVYGCLSSTWPVGSGVLVQDGVAYVAAGIANYDGTHVYALDARTGRIKWQNNTSGGNQGVGVQGHLLLHKDVLYLAGGNMLSPGAYDIRTGESRKIERTRIRGKRRVGRELFLIGDRVKVSQHRLYGLEEDLLWTAGAKQQSEYLGYTVRASGASMTVSQGLNLQIVCHDRRTELTAQVKPLWEKKLFEKHYAMAVTGNAVVVVGRRKAQQGAPSSYALAVLNLADGNLLYEKPLPACPVRWGLAIDRSGRIIVSLRDGSVLCFE